MTGRSCELAGCGRRDAIARSACGIVYVCPPCWEQVEQDTADLLAETRPPAWPVEGDAVVWADQTGTWIVRSWEDDWTVWVYRPGVRMVPVVGRPGGGMVDLAPFRLEPEHAELVAVAELRPAVLAPSGGA